MTPSPTPELKPTPTPSITEDYQLISKKFLENALEDEIKNGRRKETQEIVSYTTNLGTKPGDNYMSIIYTVDLKLKNSKKLRHLLIKCYPSHPQRQELNNVCNIFFKELGIYSDWMPELRRFQTQVVGLSEDKVIPLPYAHFVNGQCIDFQSEEGKSQMGKTLHPLENYIIMEDLRKTYGFRMTNRRESLDLDHMRLVFDALARVHSISHAYRHHVEKDIYKKFPCLIPNFDEQFIGTWCDMLAHNLEEQVTIYDHEFGPGNVLSNAAKKFSSMRKSVFEVFLGRNTAECLEPLLREKPDPKRFGKDAPNPEPWRVIIHGDIWSNNLLYRYDPDTQKPAEIALVDLQMAQEACITNDLQYVTYACTDGELRKNHLNELLELYHDKFNLVCETMKCPTLPGFNLDSLKYRFHRSKLLGYFMASGGLPIMLKEEDKVVNMEELCEDKDVMEAFRDICGGSSGNDVFRKRLIDVTTDMVNDGVL